MFDIVKYFGQSCEFLGIKLEISGVDRLSKKHRNKKNKRKNRRNISTNARKPPKKASEGIHNTEVDAIKDEDIKVEVVKQKKSIPWTPIGVIVAIITGLIAIFTFIFMIWVHFNSNSTQTNQEITVNVFAITPGTGRVMEYMPEIYNEALVEDHKDILDEAYIGTGWTSDQLRGPMDRPTFTLENPAPYITFNSMLGAPAVLNGTGDERDFVMLASNRNDTSTIRDTMHVTDGQEVYVMAFVHNNLNPNLNASVGPARNVHVNFDISGRSVLSGGQHVLPVIGYVNSASANPASVWDSTRFTANQPFSVSYVENSAQFAQAGRSPRAIGNPTVGQGANLGDIYGCTEHHGWVTFRVRINFD